MGHIHNGDTFKSKADFITQRAELVGKLCRARQEMRLVFADIDRYAAIYPPWTMKQVLAHITGWDDAVIASLQAHAAGKVPATPADRGIDLYNAQTVEERGPLSYGQLIKEWEFSRQQLIELVEQVPDERLVEPMIFPWGQQGSVAELVVTMANHEIIHAREIAKIVGNG